MTPYRAFGEKHKGFNIPIIRGIVNFIESLYIGMKTLMDSSAYFEEEDGGSSVKDKVSSDKSEKKSGSDTAYLVGSLVLSLVVAIGIFMLLPAFISNFLYKITDSDFIVNLVEGVLRLAIFLVYVAVISMMEDIKRTFMYHGAEHKSINCMESGKDLTVENVRDASRFHRRCGTSFVFIVMIISIIVFMFVSTDTMWLRLLSRLLLLLRHGAPAFPAPRAET